MQWTQPILPFAEKRLKGISSSPEREMGAYEFLWIDKKSAAKIAAMFKENRDAVPSDFVSETDAKEYGDKAIKILHGADVRDFDVSVLNTDNYPEPLLDAKSPIPFLYYRGDWDLLQKRSVAVVGTRNPSEEGKKNAQNIARWIVEENMVVISGLARGIDTAAHEAAIKYGGKTIAVLGTPFNAVYPRENRALLKQIAENHLAISHVPVVQYEQGSPQTNRFFFPARNVIMAALAQTTVIVEVGETSGAEKHARDALKLGRKLLIMDNCFHLGLRWPEKLESKGAIRIKSKDQLKAAMYDIHTQRD